MPHQIDASTLRILHPNGKTVGTGFLVASNLAVTCAHVIADADAIDGDTIQVQFTGQMEKNNAVVLSEFWSDPGKFDVAILQLEKVPTRVHPLRMERAATCRLDAKLYTFGYASAADETGISGYGEFRNFPTGNKVFQFRMHEADHGHSGAPVLDEKRGVVIGIVKKGKTEPGRNAETTFAIPTEIIWQVCPHFKPVIPPLPRRTPIVEGINLLPYDYDQRIQNFLTEYLGTDSHLVPFGGRDEALHMLDTWLAETTPYFLLAAPAGRGKSALLVRWLDILKAREDLALAFVPISIRFGTNMERVFYAALAARLAFLHGDDVPASPETSTAVYRGLVSDYLSKPLANGRTLLVVLDGLDEAADWQAGADFMPTELPIGVRVVVSARFLAGDADSVPWLRRLNWERNSQASAPSLTLLDRTGVADVLLKMGCPLDELSHNVEIVAELYRLSEGDPLLINFYVYDLWRQKEKAPRLKPEELKKLKPGYEEYFKKWWKDQKTLWGEKAPLKVKTTKLVFNLLCGAMGALTIDDLIALDTKDELDSFAIEDAIETLDRFVISVTIDERTEQTGYVITHPKFCDYFWDKLSDKERNQIEKRFLNWGECTFKEFVNGKGNPKDKDDVPFYVVRNYGAHLARANQPIEKWLLLIHHQQWAQAWFTVEGAYGGYLQDVQRVWEQCCLLNRQAIDVNGKAPVMGEQIRCALIEGSIRSSISNIFPELIAQLIHLNIWTSRQALVYIRQMPDKQSEAIRLVLPFLSEKEIFDVFTFALQLQDEWECTNSLCAIIPFLPDQLLDSVLKKSKSIKNPYARLRILELLSPRLSVIDHALDVVNYENKFAQGNLLTELAKWFPEDHLDTLKNLTIERQIDQKGLEEFLIVLSKRIPKKKSRELLEIVKNVEDASSRAEILGIIAEKLPDVTDEITKAINEVKDEVDRARSIVASSKLLQLDLLEISNSFKDKRAKDIIWVAYIRSFPLHQYKNTIKLVQKLGSAERSQVLAYFAENLPKDQLSSILMLTQDLDDLGDQIKVLNILIKRIPKIQIKNLINWGKQIKYEGQRSEFFITLAEYLPKKQLTYLLDAVQEIRDDKHRVRVLVAISRHFPEVITEALNSTKIIHDEAAHIRFLSHLVRSLPQIADEIWLEFLQQREQFDKEMPQTWYELAKNFHHKHLHDLTAHALQLQNHVARASFLMGLAERLPNDELHNLIDAAKSIEHVHLGEIFAFLAEHLPTEKLNYLLPEALDTSPNWTPYIILARRIHRDQFKKMVDETWRINDVRAHEEVWNILSQRLSQKQIQEIYLSRMTVDNEWRRADVLSAIAPRLPKSMLLNMLDEIAQINQEGAKAKILSALADYLPKKELEKLLDMIRLINDEFWRAFAMSSLTKRMPELVTENLEVLSKYNGYEYWRANVLISLAQSVPDVYLKDLLSVTHHIEDDISGNRARVFCALAKRLPDLLEETLSEVEEVYIDTDRAKLIIILAEFIPKKHLSTLLRMIDEIYEQEYAATALIALTKRYPSEKLNEILTATYRLSYDWERNLVFAVLAQQLKLIPMKISYLYIEELIPLLSRRIRKELLSDFDALISSILYIGVPQTPYEIYEAIRDVTAWWP